MKYVSVFITISFCCAMLFLVGCFGSYRNMTTKAEVTIVRDTIYVKTDSIIYSLSDEAVKIVEGLIKDREVVFCQFDFLYDLNFSTLHFYFTDLDVDNSFVDKTNRFLRIGNRCIPVLFWSDANFAGIPPRTMTFKRKYSKYNSSYIILSYKDLVLGWYENESCDGE